MTKTKTTTIMKNYRTMLLALIGAGMLSVGSSIALAQDIESPLRETSWGMTRDEVLTVEAASGLSPAVSTDNQEQFKSTLLNWPINVMYSFNEYAGLLKIELQLEPMDSLQAARAYQKVALMLTSQYGRAERGTQTNESTHSGLLRYWWRTIDTDIMISGAGSTSSHGSTSAKDYVVLVECRSRKFAEPLPCIRSGGF